MPEIHPALQTLIEDPEGNQAKGELNVLIKRMRHDDVHPQGIYRALAKTLMDLCNEEYYRWEAHRLWAKKFIRETGEAFQRKADFIALSGDGLEPWGPELDPTLREIKNDPEATRAMEKILGPRLIFEEKRG